MEEKKKRKSVYDYAAIKKYRASLSEDQKKEINRRKKFSAAKNFLLKNLFTEEEFNELDQLISEKKKEMQMKSKISIDSSALIADVQETIELFGDSHRVYAVYALRPVDGQEFEYISDFVDADKPERDEADDEEEFKQLLSDWQANIDSLKDTKNELMTASELLTKLEEQDSIF